MKKPSDWQLSLEHLPKLLQGLDTDRKDAGSGMSYEDYLHVLLMAKGKDTKVSRAMDMVELSVRLEEGRENFRLDSCIVALEASVDIKANKRKVFNVARQYCYE